MHLSCDLRDDDRTQKHGNVISEIIARMTETTKEYLVMQYIYIYL